MRLFQKQCKKFKTTFGLIMVEVPEFPDLLLLSCLHQDPGLCNVYTSAQNYFVLMNSFRWFISKILREHAKTLGNLTDDSFSAQVRSCLNQVHEEVLILTSWFTAPLNP
jgi:hypothetical protein